MSATSDPDELLKAAANGSYRAFEQIVERLNRRLVARCQQHCWPPVDAEDVVQNVWLEAFLKIKTFRDFQGLINWLMSAAVLRAIDESRRWKTPTGGSQDAADAIDPRSQDSLDVLISKEQYRIFEDCLKHNATGIQAFILKHIEGLTYAEIASRLDLPLGTVASQISRAKTEIKECLEGGPS